jgi:hypothetical protein
MVECYRHVSIARVGKLCIANFPRRIVIINIISRIYIHIMCSNLYRASYIRRLDITIIACGRSSAHVRQCN